MDTFLLITLAAVLVGVVVGLTGMGGGALMTPTLVLGFGVPPLTAVSSDLVAAAAMKPVGSWVHMRRGTVHWPLVGWLMVGSIPTAAAGVIIVKFGFEPDELTATMKKIIGAVLLVAAAGLILRAWVRLRERAQVLSGNVPLPLSTERPDVRPRVAWTITVGAMGGLLVGLTSIGSGSLMIVALMALYPKLRAPQLVGTDLAQAVPLVIVAAVAHIFFGDVDWAIVAPVVVGSVPGAYLGAKLSSQLSGGLVRRALALILLAAALLMLKVAPLTVAIVVAVALVAGSVAWALLRRHYGFPAFRVSRE